MLTTSKNHNPNYLAKIHQIDNLRPHPNADRLQLTMIDGNSVIVGIDTKIGDFGVFFPLESQIDAGYLSFNNQFEDKTKNANPEAKGFFNKHGRVRAVALRSAKSEGYWTPLNTLLSWRPGLNLKVEHGTYFDTIDDVLLVQKYIPKTNQTSRTQATPKSPKQKRESKVIDNQFRFHSDTLQFGRNAHRIKDAVNVIVTQKLHGTSAVFANVLCKRKLSWFEKIAKKFGANVSDSQYDGLYSSRTVIKNKFMSGSKFDNPGWYGVDVWGQAYLDVAWALEKGITVYAEIVGYLPDTQKMIQKGYPYGCKEGDYDIYVYRITYTNADGHVFEFTWEQLTEYCERYQLKTVPLIFKGSLADFKVVHSPYHSLDDSEKLVEQLRERYCEKMLSNGSPDEGVCIRIERGMQVETFKLKSFKFLERESKMLDTEEVDIETEEATASEE